MECLSLTSIQIFVSVTSLHFYFILGLIYIPPDSDFDSAFDALSLTLNSVSEGYPDLSVVVGGDFNCRMANLNQLSSGMMVDSCVFSNLRSSNDQVLYGRGRSLVSIMESCNLVLLNGRAPRDSPAVFTFLGGQGFSVIDLIWCSFNGLFLFHDLVVFNLPTHSDHLPLFYI